MPGRRARVRAVAARAAERAREVTLHESNVLVVSALGVGVLAGAGAVVLEYALRLFGAVFLGGESSSPAAARILLAPAAGGLLVGPIVARFASEARGHGVPEVMEAVALRGGRIRTRVAFAKTVASAITIGSGGSAGREGPIVQIGAALGSAIGGVFRMSDARTRTLVACGAAGGIAAAFNAPLAGVFFALEVILQRFTTRGFATVVLSAVTASVVWRAAFGNTPVLEVPLFGLRNAVELVAYAVLGLLSAVAAVGFVKALYWAEDRFDALPVPRDLLPAAGGLLLGVVGIATWRVIGAPLVYGSGLDGINDALQGRLAWWAMLALLGAKVVATSASLGSGGSGGVFAPSLFLGAMLGGAFGAGVNAVIPDASAPAGAYAMVGMAAVFAAAGQAPISAILILFEMTNDYRIILPLMLSCITATAVYSSIQRDSIYLVKIRRKGIDLNEGREQHLLERTPVSRAVIRDIDTVPVGVARDPVRLAAALSASESSTGMLVVVGDEGRFVGVIPHDRADAGHAHLDDLVDDRVIPVLPTESLDDALQKLAPRGLEGLPVIADLASRRVIGVVTRDSLLSAYWASLDRERRASRA